MAYNCKCDICGNDVHVMDKSEMEFCVYDYKKYATFTNREYQLCPKCAKIIKKDIEMLHKAYSIKRPIDRLAKILEERE